MALRSKTGDPRGYYHLGQIHLLERLLDLRRLIREEELAEEQRQQEEEEQAEAAEAVRAFDDTR